MPAIFPVRTVLGAIIIWSNKPRGRKMITPRRKYHIIFCFFFLWLIWLQCLGFPHHLGNVDVEVIRAWSSQSNGDGNWPTGMCPGWARHEKQERGVRAGVATGRRHFQPGARTDDTATQQRARRGRLRFCQRVPDEHELHQQSPKIRFVLHYSF